MRCGLATERLVLVASGVGIVAVVAWKPFPSNLPLVMAWQRRGIRAELLRPSDARRRLAPGDVALVRLDVTPTLDGVEAGLVEISALERRGVRLLNRPSALLAAHDKRETARLLTKAGLPHPRTMHRERLEEIRLLDPPFVLKPRFGSWGRDVMLCRDRVELERCLARIANRSWFRRHGVLIQELVRPLGYDLRVVVAGEHVVGAERREAASGEWHTNEALGGKVVHAQPSEEARALAVDAARAVGADLVGVDLLPVPDIGYVVSEVNGAVDFDDTDSLTGRSVYTDAADALGLGAQRAAVGSSRQRSDTDACAQPAERVAE
jgi:[lysine-biosynthesis-protein LysW]---L-2-aminoadipate ligase